MPAEQSETIVAVPRAAGPISIEIDAMVAALPAGADLAEIAIELIYELGERCDSRDFIAIFKEALTARPDRIGSGFKQALKSERNACPGPPRGSTGNMTARETRTHQRLS